MSLQNPLGIAGPAGSGNYTQSDYRIPSVNANVVNYPVGYNVLNLTWPIPAYTQPNYPSAAVKTGGTLL